MKNVKDDLKQYSDIINEINFLKKKIKEIEIKGKTFSAVEASTKHPPYQKHVVTIYHTNSDYQEKILYYRNLLKKKYNELIDKKIKIQEYINNLPTSRLRMIFEYRYIDCLSWQKVSLKIGGCSEDSIRMEHDRYLKKK